MVVPAGHGGTWLPEAGAQLTSGRWPVRPNLCPAGGGQMAVCRATCCAAWAPPRPVTHQGCHHRAGGSLLQCRCPPRRASWLLSPSHPLPSCPLPGSGRWTPEATVGPGLWARGPGFQLERVHWGHGRGCCHAGGDPWFGRTDASGVAWGGAAAAGVSKSCSGGADWPCLLTAPGEGEDALPQAAECADRPGLPSTPPGEAAPAPDTPPGCPGPRPQAPGLPHPPRATRGVTDSRGCA